MSSTIMEGLVMDDLDGDAAEHIKLQWLIVGRNHAPQSIHVSTRRAQDLKVCGMQVNVTTEALPLPDFWTLAHDQESLNTTSSAYQRPSSRVLTLGVWI